MKAKHAAATLLILTASIFSLDSSANAQTTTSNDSPRASRVPRAYKSVGSDLIFYVESDGRHVTAIDPSGRIVWHKDPFVDGDLKPYRVAKPLIVFIGEPSDRMVESRTGKFIAIGFNSSQAGIIDVANGKFYFIGQD